ncbi:hypothetical protein [Denitromonas iodatirespirans]|uniref:Uncharacterized protein n=1 Tax=Denitromonas iodatirespirans TaxID=2795389 RepID=A0A944HD15_DENI1|nr:hypothetical protein [Denitromonas iodatirespirans]MBT0961661.1 hypothetical protein [Denitromonas iodatirespirans]
MRPLHLRALSAALLMANTACSINAAAPSSIPIAPPAPTRCLILCPEPPTIDRDPIQTIKDLQDWGSDCRLRQMECRRWAIDRNEHLRPH